MKSNSDNTWNILEKGGDYVTVEANLASPAVLLITDNFRQGWRIKPLSPGMQKEYEILSANYTFRKALAAHRILTFAIYYRRLDFRNFFDRIYRLFNNCLISKEHPQLEEKCSLLINGTNLSFRL